MLGNFSNQAVDFLGRKCGRGASAEVNGMDGFVFEIVRTHAQFLVHSLQHFVFVLHRSAKVEIAVVTRLLAKRNMEVDHGAD